MILYMMTEKPLTLEGKGFVGCGLGYLISKVTPLVTLRATLVM